MNEFYMTFVFRDTTTNGGSIYVAIHPELEGCTSQGDTPQEALANLEDAREEYIKSLIEDGLPVPLPTKLTSDGLAELFMEIRDDEV